MRTIGIWRLREEARESWDHVISDKIIYLSEPRHGNLKLSHVFAEQYFEGKVWFEVHWTFVKGDNREMHFLCICEVSPVSFPSGKREMDSERVGIHRNRPMFIHGPEFIKLPEGIVPKRVASEVRLKRVNLGCHCGWEEPSLDFVNVVPDLGDGKLNLPLLSVSESSGRREVGQGPSQLVESRPQTANEVANEHRDQFWSRFILDPDDVDGLLEIVIVGERCKVSSRSADLPMPKQQRSEANSATQYEDLSV